MKKARKDCAGAKAPSQPDRSGHPNHSHRRTKKSPASPSLADPSRSILTVVFENNHYAIVDKPALLDSQNSKPGRPSVVEWLTKKYGFAGLVHRLDFGTSGLMVCAKNAESAKKLTNELQAGKIDRVYLAVVFGRLEVSRGTIDFPLDEKPAQTRYRVLEHFANATLVEVELETGRKHQIRRHFAEQKHPLLGDHLYAKQGASRLFSRPALHAAKLTVEDKTYQSKPAADFEALLAKLRTIRS